MRSLERRNKQRGSALLIVFVFAAMIAIMLYREMPVATFEAQRQKEQILVDRGNEYKRAVKLYVRKFQTFPPSLEALENTNRMRFLRNRYVDPYTGKAEWRFLHAGPGGIIIDSKIKSTQTGLPGAPGAASGGFGSSSGFGGSGGFGSPGGSSGFNGFASNTGSTSSFGSSSFGNSNSGNSGFGSSSFGSSGGFNNNSADPNAAQNPPANPFPQRRPATANAGPVGSDLGGLQQDPQPTDSQIPTPPVPNPSSVPYAGFPGAPTGPFGGQSGGMAGSNPIAGQDPQSALQTILANQNPQPTAQTGAFNNGAFNNNNSPNGTAGQSNNVLGGGIAGVASKSPGHTIKVINDQKDRALWEFVYDMQKEAMANAPGLGGNGPGGNGSGGNANSGNSTTAPQQGFSMPSSFVSPNQNGTFGNNSTPNPPPSQPPPPNQ